MKLADEGDKENLVATVFTHVKDWKIMRIDTRGDPPPSATMRIGEYPS